VILDTVLTELGHSATFSGGGAAVIAALEQGAFDAVLMDMVSDGAATVRRIRALLGQAGSVPIIGLVGGIAPDKAASKGVNAILRKPVGPQALAEALAAVIASRA
jgi:CheY-like chemotaxis protein